MFRWFHHVGTFLLFAATVFLIIPSITSPVVNSLGLLTVDLPDNVPGPATEVSFGSWGYCVQDAKADGGDDCTKSQVGYNPTDAMTAIDGTTFSDYEEKTAKALTRVFVLHPVAAVLSFLAFVLAIGAGAVGSFLASIVALLAFVVALLVLICDFVGLGIVKSNVNDDRNGRFDAHAYWSGGMWCVVAAVVCNFLGAVIVFLSCCTGRVKRRREQRKVEAASGTHHHGAKKRRFPWQRR